MNFQFLIRNSKLNIQNPKFVLLLSPILLSWKNELFHRRERNWLRRLFIISLGAGFWLGTYWVVRRVLLYFETVHGLGPALAYQLLLIILLTFLSMLLFSNLITALSSFFLARDLDLLLSAPTPANPFFIARLIGTTLNSSWMVLFFSLPILLAYDSVFHGGALYYLWVALVLPPLLLIPAAVGVLLMHMLVYFLPARRIRDVLFFVGLLTFVVLYLLFRFSRPEQLVQPETFGHFLQFLAAMETPSAPYLPSSWAAEILGAALFKRKAVNLWFFYPLLVSYALFFPLVACCVSGLVHLAGWSKAQESRQGSHKSALLDALLGLVTRPFSEASRAMIVKDTKSFIRDTTQWSQLFLLVALVVVYVYNFKALPLDRSPLPTATLRTVVSFANLALAGFVLSAVAVRFAFPAVSLEGQAFWIVQTSPIALRFLLRSKFWLNFAPLVILGELLVYFSNTLLRVPDWMMALSLATIFLMTFGITAIGVGVGAMHPKFDYEHAAQIPTSYGGVLCMILSVAFIGVCVMIEAWPVYLLAVHALKPGMAQPSLWVLAPSLAAVAGVTALAVAMPLKFGLKGLENMRE